MSRTLLVYSSRTGNTRMVAEAVLSVLPSDTVFLPVQKAPLPEDFDFIALGFWVCRGGPDPEAARYMEMTRGRDLAFFGTLAAYPESEHGLAVIEKARALLSGNTILGSFLCQGKLAPERLERRLRAGAEDQGHPLTEARRIRLLEAARHPDAHDLDLARKAFRSFWELHQRRRALI